MLRRIGSKPKENIAPLLSEEEIRKILGENYENKIPEKEIIQKKYQEARENKCLIKLISHRNLLNKIESIHKL